MMQEDDNEMASVKGINVEGASIKGTSENEAINDSVRTYIPML